MLTIASAFKRLHFFLRLLFISTTF